MAELGDTIQHKGQLYRVVETFERKRSDGSMAVILRWASECATCGEVFDFTTPAASSKFEPNRRCQTHKRPGQRVPAETNVVDLAEHRDRVVWGIEPKGGGR